MSLFFEFFLSLLLVFLVLSMVTSSLTEFYNARIGKNSRSVMLYQALLKVFQDRQNRNYTDDLYRHPLIAPSRYDADSLPAYLDAGLVADALIDLFARQERPLRIEYNEEGKPFVVEEPWPTSAAVDDASSYKDKRLQLFANAVAKMHAGDLKTLLQSFLNQAEDLAGLKQCIMHWYNAYMDRVSGWYKRKVRKRLLWTSLIVVIALNADVFRIAITLWNDGRLRSQLAEQAVAIGADSLWLKSYQTMPAEQRRRVADSLYGGLMRQRLPLGWRVRLSEQELSALSARYADAGKSSIGQRVAYQWQKAVQLVRANFREYVSINTLLGWLLMAFAVHLGALFWFQILVRFVNIRGAGKPPA